LGILQGASAGDNSLLIDLKAREWRGFATGGNDDVLSAKSALPALKQVDLDFVLTDEASSSLDIVDAVLPVSSC
jgi:hypothetical protein